MTNAVLLAFLAATAVAAQPKLPDIAYDPKAPLGLKETMVKDFGFARLMDIAYDSPRGGRVNGYAVIPAGVAHPAGIVWQALGAGRPVEHGAGGVEHGAAGGGVDPDQFADEPAGSATAEDAG